jgi:hypothetical protein
MTGIRNDLLLMDEFADDPEYSTYLTEKAGLRWFNPESTAIL